jgi:putative glycerol-1-phosphate prenyltransferase
MHTIYNTIFTNPDKKYLAILLDPDKLSLESLSHLIPKINNSPATHIFVGGSSFNGNHLDELIVEIKTNTNLPIILFPGNPSQISNHADAILFLQLLSGRNPDFLIDYQVKAAPILKSSPLEVISTGYILVDGGNETAVERVSKTKPIAINNIQEIVNTAIASEFIGNKFIYLEAGSGAKNCIPEIIIQQVASNISIPLIVGGGITSLDKIDTAYKSGANLVVIGTAFENNPDFFNQ